jgi:hypothetical protein
MAATPAQLSSAQQLLEDVRILSADDMEGRLVGSPGGAKARTYILGRLNEIGLAPALGASFEHTFQFQRQADTLSGVNLLAMIPGTGGSNRALIVMAHYDHVGVRNGEIFNGADDNASGVAALLQIATSMKTRAPLHDVIFAIVDGEANIRGYYDVMNVQRGQVEIERLRRDLKMVLNPELKLADMPPVNPQPTP